MPVTELSTPPKKIRVREVSSAWVEAIKCKLVDPEPSLPVTTLAAVVEGSQTVDELRDGFQPDQHRLFTLGGNHLRLALKELVGRGDLAAEHGMVGHSYFIFP